MDSIVFKHKEQNKLSIVMKSPFYIHFLVEENDFESSDCEASSNHLKIIIRNSVYDGFSYEYIFHSLTKIFNCEHTVFNLFLFENIDDIDILSNLIMFFNHIYSCSFSIELDEIGFIVKNKNEILFQSCL